MSKIKVISMNEEEFNKYVENMKDDDIVFGSLIKTNSEHAKYFNRFFKKDGSNVKISVQLRDIRMKFRIPAKKKEQQADKLKASFKFDPNNRTHKNLLRINELSEKLAKEKFPSKEYHGCVQKTIKIENSDGIDEIKQIDPIFWVIMPGKDRKTGIETCACKIHIATSDGTSVTTKAHEDLNIHDLVDQCKYGALVKSCYINFDNFSAQTTGIHFPCTFNHFKPMLLRPEPKREDTDFEKMKEEFENQILEENINNVENVKFEMNTNENIN